MSEPGIRQIPYWEVEGLWPAVAPMLQRAINVAPDEWNLDAVYKKLVNPFDPSPMQLWYWPAKFALVTQIQTFPAGGRKCLLFLCGGEDLQALREAKASVAQWAKRYMGCNKFIIYGRRGFLKALPDFYEVSTIMESNI